MNAASIALLLAVRVATTPVLSADTTSVGAMMTAQTPADAPSPQPGRFDPTRFDSVTAVALRSLFDTAAAHKLPTTPLINKALQGAANKASGARILSAVKAQYSAMVDAKAALGEASESELDSGADAIRIGLDGKSLVAIRAARPSMGSAVTALVVATDLVKRGINPGKARDAVTSLARVSRTDDSLNNLQQLVAKNSERGPGMAQDALERYLKANVPGNASPASAKPVSRPPGPPDAS